MLLCCLYCHVSKGCVHELKHANVVLSCCIVVNSVQWPKPIPSASTPQAISNLIARVLDSPTLAKQFQILINPALAVNDKDVVKINNGAETGSIAISASSGVAAAWGFNYYLKYVSNSSCSFKNIFF